MDLEKMLQALEKDSASQTVDSSGPEQGQRKSTGRLKENSRTDPWGQGSDPTGQFSGSGGSSGSGRTKQTSQGRTMKTIDVQSRNGGSVKSWLNPLNWVDKVRWLTNTEPGVGGFAIPCRVFAGYCLLLTMEQIYLPMPNSDKAQTYAMREGIAQDYNQAAIVELPFLPKPGVDDSANIARLSPVPVISRGLKLVWNATAGNLVTLSTSGVLNVSMPLQPHWVVWYDLEFYVASFFAIGLNGIEGMLFRKMFGMSWEEKVKMANSWRARKKLQNADDSILTANIATANANYHGLGKLTFFAVMIIVVYGLELSLFSRSFRDRDIDDLVTVIYMLMSLFGFEVAYALGTPEKKEA